MIPDRYEHLRNLFALGLSPKQVFESVKTAYGWLTISALYRVMIKHGLRPARAEALGLRAAHTEKRLLLEYPIGKELHRLRVTGPPVLKPVGTHGKHWFFPVTCNCAAKTSFEVDIGHLRRELTKSCGCQRSERFAALNRTHGANSHWILKRLRAVHAGMLRRVKTVAVYRKTGVCAEWRDCLTFMIWALENGYAPGRSINRKDNTKGYSPENCEFTSDCGNANNRSSSRIVIFEGKTRTLAEHCRLLGLNYSTVSTRLNLYGWSLERSLARATGAVKEGPLIYLGWRPEDAVLTVGKSESNTRFKPLRHEGFRVIGVYAPASSFNMGFLEFMLHHWLDEHGIKRGVASKSKNSDHSPETFFKRDAVANNFKFRHLCVKLESKVPEVLRELKTELERLRGIQSASARLESVRSEQGSEPTVLALPEARKCHQRLIREQTLDADLQRLIPILGDLTHLRASQFSVALEPYTDEHRDFIRKYEWLGTPGASIKWCFASRYAGHLGGVVLVSEPYHPSETTALIARGACAGWTPKNLGSKSIMAACRWLAANTVKCKFIAYADAEADEIGQIYQACNFKFLGWKSAEYGVDEKGRRRSFQTLKRTSRMVPWLAKQGINLPDSCFTAKGYLRWGEIAADLKVKMREHIKQERDKLRVVTLRRGSYVLLLGKNKRETRKLNASFKVTVVPYPKRCHRTFLPISASGHP